MSNYNGRRAPILAHQLQNLNAMSPEESTSNNDRFDLSLFTNTEFFDLDSAQNTDYQAQPVKIDTAAPTPAVSTNDDPISASAGVGDVSSIEFVSGDYNFFEPGNYGGSIGSFNDGPHNFQPLQPNQGHSHIYPNPVASHQLPQFQAPSSRPAEKRKADDLTPTSSSMGLEESSRMAAEEDKRRRNTAASARFRIKKKQREAALEKSAKEMTDKVTSLESKVSQLETENRWLKNLLTDKNGENEDILALWKDFTQQRAKADSATTSKKSDR